VAKDRYATLDLNLLKTFLVLAQEQNMRKAAARLYVTQPAVSQALKKLRYHFEDELFIRTPTGLQATSYTEHLVANLSPILDELSLTLNDHSDFEPASVNETIRIALAPNVTSFLTQGVFSRIHAMAPKAVLHMTAWSGNSLQELLTGELHLGVNMEIGQTPKEVMMQKLADDRFMAYARKGHPLASIDGDLSLKNVADYELATLIIPDWNTRVSRVEQVLRENGLKARIGFRSDLPGVITDAIRETDMVYPASSFISKKDLRGLDSFNVSLNNGNPHFPVMAYYHQKNRRNPLTLWLFEIMKELLSKP
jgi:DNA-binding transcriptional LysR family regulator